jgi:cyclophilin family peptidyl-prolyl cis-trans isomerase
MRLHLVTVSFCLALAGVSPCAVAQPAAAPAAPVAAQLEVNRWVHYANEPIELRVTIRNTSSEALTNPIPGPLFENLVVRDGDGRDLAPAKPGAATEPSRPSSLDPGASYGGVVDLGAAYPATRQPGRYQVHFASGGVLSDLLTLTVIQPYDAAKRHRARIDTDRGAIVIELAGAAAPIATKTFVDLARGGYFDGLEFHEVHADAFVLAGDPRFGDRPRTAFMFPAESTSVPIVAGTVLAKPAGPAPPTNSAEFIVLLKPQPSWTGQATVLGQVVSGFEVAQAISRVATEPSPSRRPSPPVRIRGVAIEELEPPPRP